MRRRHLAGMKARLAALLACLAVAATAAGGARAGEAIPTGASGAPPAAEAPAPLGGDDSPEAIGAWARGVLAGAPAAETAAPAKAGACRPNDGKPHGEVWAGVGTGGYREVGGVVTQPVGDCGQVTIGVDRTEGAHGRRWR
jgi:hypothetical protein